MCLIYCLEKYSQSNICTYNRLTAWSGDMMFTRHYRLVTFLSSLLPHGTNCVADWSFLIYVLKTTQQSEGGLDTAAFVWVCVMKQNCFHMLLSVSAKVKPTGTLTRFLSSRLTQCVSLWGSNIHRSALYRDEASQRGSCSVSSSGKIQMCVLHDQTHPRDTKPGKYLADHCKKNLTLHSCWG